MGTCIGVGMVGFNVPAVGEGEGERRLGGESRGGVSRGGVGGVVEEGSYIPAIYCTIPLTHRPVGYRYGIGIVGYVLYFMTVLDVFEGLFFFLRCTLLYSAGVVQLQGQPSSCGLISVPAFQCHVIPPSSS
jgi:hypothetical protein